jgi:hypothetical protein
MMPWLMHHALTPAAAKLGEWNLRNYPDVETAKLPALTSISFRWQRLRRLKAALTTLREHLVFSRLRRHRWREWCDPLLNQFQHSCLCVDRVDSLFPVIAVGKLRSNEFSRL